MSGRTAFAAASAALASMLALVTPASAATQPAAISGTLSKAGYKVLAVAPTGRVMSARVGRTFRLRPPAASVSLQLRGPDGTYAGPVAILRKGRTAILGVRAGARLGKITIRAGYAVVTKAPASRFVDARFAAKAKDGVPIGAGRLGLVRTALPGSGSPGDRDRDGVPDVLDIDDDGDRIIDGYDTPKPGKARAAQEGVGHPFKSGNFFTVSTQVMASPSQAANADAGSTDAQIANAEQHFGMLGFMWRGTDLGSEELDCGALAYCSAGGTGRYERGAWQYPDYNSVDPRLSALPFPACCDADHDGLGSFTATKIGNGLPGTNGMQLYPGATADQIHAGDVLIERATVNGAPIESASTVGYVFSSFPVIAGYDDGHGDAATMTYPLPSPSQCGIVPNACPQPVRSGPDGKLVMRLRIARPQRLRIPGDPGTGRWMDVGNLSYGVIVTQTPNQPGTLGTRGGYCRLDSYTSVDPAVTPETNPVPPVNEYASTGATFKDISGDRPAGPANTIAMTLDVTACLASFGYGVHDMPNLSLTIVAWALGSTPAASAQSSLAFTPQ